MKKLLLFCNLTCLFAAVVVTIVSALWPEHLQALGLTGEAGKVILLQLISCMLLLAAFQNTLEQAWRRFALASCFIVLGQSVLMSLLMPA